MLSNTENEFYPIFDENEYKEKYFEYIEGRYHKNKDFINKFEEGLHGLGVFDFDEIFDQMKVMINPNYYPFTNKKILSEIEQTKGQNLLEGLKKLQRDIQYKLIPQLSKIENFTLGENIAPTKGYVVYENKLMQLIHYKALTKKQHTKPVLIVPPWINKFYIFDLDKEKSFVRYMLKKNMDVYIISWKNPDEKDRNIPFSAYIKKGVEESINYIQKDVHLMGLCLGGLAAVISAIRNKGKLIKSLTTLATPTDFSKLQLLHDYMKKIDQNIYKRYINQKGLQSGKDLLQMFSMMRYESMILKNMIDQYYLNKEPQANPYLYWNMDSTNLPARMQIEYFEKFFINNELFEGKYVLDNKILKMEDLKIPLYVVATEKDHIVPYTSAFAISKFDLDCRYVFSGSGHIAGIINPPEQKKYAYKVYDRDKKLIKSRKYSWWTDWNGWINPMIGEKKEASQDQKFLEEAPGRFALNQPFIEVYKTNL